MAQTNTAEVLPIEQEEAQVPALAGGGHDLGVPLGMEGFNQDDIVIPRMTIVQPTSEEGTPGTFRFNLTGDEYIVMKVVFLKASKGRVLFDNDDLTAGPRCGSNDRIRPSDHFESPIAEACAECPLSQWDNRTPPECNETYTLLGLDSETLIPFFFQVKSTAIRPAKMFLSAVALKGRKLKAALCDFEVTLKLKEVKGEKGKYYVPIFFQPTYLEDHPYREEAALYRDEEPGFEAPVKSGENSGEGQENAGISRIDISIMRNLSHGEEVIKYSAFPMMRKPLKRAGSTSQGDDVAGPTAILEFDPDKPESKPDWLEAETKEPIDAILLWIEKKVAEIYRAVNTGGIQATEVSSQAKSGVALKYEFQQLNSKLASKAQNGQEMEKQVVRLWLKWQNTEEKFDEIKIDWPKRFSVEDLAADLENALVAKTLIGSEKFTKALAKVLARRVLTLPDEEWSEIDKDIDEGPVKPPVVGDEETTGEGQDQNSQSGEAEAA